MLLARKTRTRYAASGNHFTDYEERDWGGGLLPTVTDSHESGADSLRNTVANI